MYLKDKKDIYCRLLLWLAVIISMIVAFFFCYKKQGYHYDENYSYYSTDVTNGLYPTDYEWKSTDEIRSEYMVLDGETLNLGMVKLSQTYDVHPPLYYFVLRIVCFFSKNTFSKWQGLSINLIFYLICLMLLWQIADIAGRKSFLTDFFTLMLFGLSPGFLSAVTFIRMYVMLSMWCFLVLIIAMKAIRDNEFTFKKVFVPTALVTMAGFLTHYYYMVFAFFVTAYVCIYLVIKKDTRIKAFIYGGSVCLGMAAAIIYYPACLGHIFSGYRGVESTQAFMDMSNTVDRIDFFVQMLNDYTFSGMFYILLLVGLLLYMFYSYRRKVRWANNLVSDSVLDKEEKIDEKDDEKNTDNIGAVIGLLLSVTVGYFLIVCKTAMTPSNPAEALRYESPVYGLLILLVTMGITAVFDRIKASRMIPCAVLILAIICQIHGLCSDKVFFLYEGADDLVKWAASHRDCEVAFIYNPNNSWMIWNDGPELMEYRDIYFIPYDTDKPIDDERLLNAKDIIIYACRTDESFDIINSIIDANDALSGYEKAGERTFVDVYELK
ncbi:MAG: hypothetical protein IKQ44_07875 [Lachnospiraceae bacterium]|nr:hypothetical protein [Lachnospiraceae bacterium]